MSQRLTLIGNHVINLDALANCHWEGRTLIVRYVGGGFEKLEGKEARTLWHIVAADLPLIEHDAPPDPRLRVAL